MNYFVHTYAVYELEGNLNAFIEQGHEIVNVFHIGEHMGIAQVTVITKKPITHAEGGREE